MFDLLTIKKPSIPYEKSKNQLFEMSQSKHPMNRKCFQINF